MTNFLKKHSKFIPPPSKQLFEKELTVFQQQSKEDNPQSTALLGEPGITYTGEP